LKKIIVGLLKEIAGAWQRDQVARLAAALAYYTIFSITPLLIIIIAILGLVFGERAAQAEIAKQLEDLVGTEAALMIETMLANFGSPTADILTSLVGLGTMLYGATGLFSHVQGALNTIWHAPARSNNGVLNFFKRRALHLALIFGVGALLLLALFAELVITTIVGYLNLENFPSTLHFLVSMGMLTILSAIIFKILPQVEIAWRDVLIGAVVTSLLFNGGRILIGMYMRWSNIGSIFGAAGSLAMLLVWIYYSAQIFLLGAEFTHVYALKFGSLREPPGDPAAEAVAPLSPATSMRNDSLPPAASSAVKVEPALPSAERTNRAWPKKTLAATTVMGTVVASILGAHWWRRRHQNRHKVA